MPAVSTTAATIVSVHRQRRDPITILIADPTARTDFCIGQPPRFRTCSRKNHVSRQPPLMRINASSSISAEITTCIGGQCTY